MGVRSEIQRVLWLLAAVALALQWILLRLTGAHLEPHWEALLSGLGILGAAFLLSWAAEASSGMLMRLIGPASGAPIQLQRRQRRSRAQVGLWPPGSV